MRILGRLVVLTLAITAGAFWSAMGLYAAPQDDQAEAVRAAVTGFAANMHAFEFYTCRFTVTEARARSREDARAGRWINPVSCECRIIVDGDRELYEDFATPVPSVKKESPQAKAATPVGGLAVTQAPPFIRTGKVSNGKQDLSYVPDMGVINLFDERLRAPWPTITPWGRNMMGHRKTNWCGPDALLADPQERECLSAGAGFKEWEGRPVYAVGFNWTRYQEIRWFYLDPGQGYLPVYCTWESPHSPAVNGIPATESFLTSARSCSKGRWFPERSICLQHLGVEPRVRVIEIKVTELEVDKRPTKEDFALTIRAGTSVNSDLVRENGFVFHQDEKVGPDDVAQVWALFEQSRPDGTGRVIPRSSGWWRWAGLAVGVLLAAWGMSRIIRRHRAALNAARSST